MVAISWAPAKTYQTTGFIFFGSYKKIYAKKFIRNWAVSTGCLLANFANNFVYIIVSQLTWELSTLLEF